MSVNKEGKTVVGQLKRMLSQKPNTEEVILEHMHITDLQPYMDYLAKFQNLKSLSIFGNRLRELPVDMSRLKTLQILDISNNLLNDVERVSVSLRTLPNLQTLKYPVKKQKQEILIQNLHNLTVLNDLHIIRQVGKKPLPLQFMHEGALQQFKKQLLKEYYRIKSIEETYLNEKKSQKEKLQGEQKLIYEMNDIIQNSLKKIKEKDGDVTAGLQNIYYIKTKYEIYQLIRTQCLNVAMDYYGDLGRILKDVLEMQNYLFEATVKQSLKLVHYEYQIKQIQRQKNEKKSNLISQNKIVLKNEQLQKQIKRIKKQNDEISIQNKKLESQNTRYLQSLVRFAKGDKSGFSSLGMMPTQAHFSKKNNLFNNNLGVPDQTKIVQRSTKMTNISKQSIPANNYSSCRNLTLKQLKDIIEQIYEGKVKFDQKNLDGKVPKQTMHEYLFTHLNQKYGLRTLTIEAASSIIGGIQTYSAEDNDVAVFGKIMRNQVDEEFRNTQQQLKVTINGILKMMVKNQHPLKNAQEIEHLYKQKTDGDIYSEQIEQLVKFLYNKADSDKILNKIQMLYRLNKPKTAPKQKQDQPTRRLMMEQQSFSDKQRKKLNFSIFLQKVLDFQMKNREMVLQPLLRVFKARDTDCDGIVDETQFIQIVEQLSEQSRSLIPEMLMIVDPYDRKSITFTQMARLLANYPQKNPILSQFAQKDDQQYDDIQ